MRWSLDVADHGSSPARRRLHLTGLLVVVGACCVSSDLLYPGSLTRLPQGSGAQLPVTGGLSTSWLQVRDTRLPANTVLHDARPDPDLDSESASVNTWRERRSARAQTHVRASPSSVLLNTFPKAVDGVIQSQANYTVVLRCELLNSPKAVLKWTLNGQPCQADAVLLIRRLAREHLGSYVCEAKNGTEQFFSAPLTLQLLEGEPINPAKPDLFEDYLTGGPAIGILVAGVLGALAMVAGAAFAAHQWERRRIRG